MREGPRGRITYDAVYAFANALANLSDPGQAMNRTALAAVLNRIDFGQRCGRPCLSRPFLKVLNRWMLFVLLRVLLFFWWTGASTRLREKQHVCVAGKRVPFTAKKGRL